MWNMLGMRRRMAASTSWGRLVAPITITLQFTSVISPSQKLMNCVLIMAVASWSVADLDRRKESNEKVIIKTDHSVTTCLTCLTFFFFNDENKICSSILFRFNSDKGGISALRKVHQSQCSGKPICTPSHLRSSPDFETAPI